MPNSYFNFKKFSIQQDKCAMKVGTDGVILGAWCDVSDSKNVLDIGTGTGLIALMIAQKNPTCLIDAIEINRDAANQAVENITKSEWKNRINVFNESLQNFKPDKKYDHIISNPPFYIDALKAKNTGRNIARHTDSLHYSEIIDFGSKWLDLIGEISLIVPIDQAKNLMAYGNKLNFFTTRLTTVFSVPGKPIRSLVTLSKEAELMVKEEIIIEEFGRHQYSQKYIELCKPFYLDK